MSKISSIAILGAGNGGCAFAGHLAMKGFEVRLYEHPTFERNIQEIRGQSGVEVTGKVQGFGRLSIVTTDISQVVPGANIVMIVVPAFAQQIFINEALPHLEEGQIVVFNPDNFGSLVFRESLKNKGLRKNVKVAGTASLLYACRRLTPSKVDIRYVKDVMPVAALPAVDTNTVVNSLKEMFGQFVPADNVLEVGFGNVNQVLHSPTVVLNAGRIENTSGNFMFYWEGMTESVCRVMERVDEERINVAAKMGVRAQTTLDYLRQYYSSEEPGDSLHDFVTKSRVHGGHGPDAPKDLYHRYITEDVPNGLVPVWSFGKLAGVAVPTVDAVILLSSILNSTDYFREGRTVDKMGLSELSPHQILELVKVGEERQL